jgi:hypothetical protein
VLFFHDKINAVNAGGCLIVFSGVILYKVSLIFADNTETYSPIEQENEIQNDCFVKEETDTETRTRTGSNKSIDGGGRLQDYASNRSLISSPRLDRASSSIGNGDSRIPIKDDRQGNALDTTKTNLDIDEFVEEGMQDKILKLKL